MRTLHLYVIVFGVIFHNAIAQQAASSDAANEELLAMQNKSGTIFGTVIDIIDRSPVDKATVELLGTGFRTVTSKDGQFKLPNLPEGFYQLRASASGYDVQTQNNLYVEPGRNAPAFFMLKKSGLKELSENENSAPVPISTKSPNYPEEARKNGVEGMFYFRIKVNEKGEIQSAVCVERNVYADNGKLKNGQVIEKYQQAVNQLEKEALDAVWQWKFKPALKDGKGISVELTLPIKYKLSKD